MRESPLEIADEYDDRLSCPKCGNDMEWVECWMIDCEDGLYDIGEEDPINYGPGTMIKCNNCDGNGGWFCCKHCEKQSASTSCAEPK